MPVLLPVSRLAALCDPFSDPWECGTFGIEEVRQAVLSQNLMATAFSRTTNWSREEHIARVAHLVVHGWEGAVEVDVGVPALRCHVAWPLTDGNHRLAAALVRGDRFISASVAGDIDFAFELFGVDVREPGFEAIAA